MKRLLLYGIAFLMALAVTFGINSWGEIEIKTSGGSLYGELLNTRSKGLVIITAGSGPTDRNGNSKYIEGKNNSLLDLAYGLKKQGVSTFRYDKRTTGKSGKTFMDRNIVFEDFVGDLESVIRYFKDKGNFENIYLLGHSQGALVSVIAAQRESVDGVIYLAGQGRTIDEIFIEQLDSGEENQLYSDMIDTIKELKKKGKANEISIGEKVRKFLNVENQKFLLSWMKYNPVEEVSKNKAPMLFVYGTTDFQVKHEEMHYFFTQEDYFRNALEQPKYKVIDGMNHVLKEAPEDKKENEKRYIDPSYRLHPELVPEIVSFIEKDRDV